MKLLLLLILLLPSECFARQHHLKCDNDKAVRIIHAKKIIETSPGNFTISGHVVFKIWGEKYKCDVAVFDCDKKRLTMSGHMKMDYRTFSGLKVNMATCVTLLISEGITTSDAPGR